jgi:peptide/nickel transport system substrate-binding protein
MSMRRAGALALSLAALAASALTVSSGTPTAGAATGHVLSYADDPVGTVSDNFNPFSTESALYLLDAATFIYEPLLQWDLLKTDKYYPWLATKFSWANDGKTLTLDLRHGVQWTDGKPLTSTDVVFTFELMKKHPGLNTNSVTFQSVKAKGRYAVELHFSAPAYSQLYYLTSQLIVPKHLWSTVKNPTRFTDPHPVGTGPFTLKSFTSHLVTLVSEVQLPVLDSNTSGALLLAQGQLSWGGFFIPSVTSSFVDKDPTHFHDWFPPTSALVYLVPNLSKSPMNQLPVREAISDALDRTQIDRIGEQGEDPPDTTPTGLVLPTEQSWLAPQYATVRYQQNTQEADALLTKAGYKMGSSGIRTQPDGKPLSITLTLPTSYSDWMSDAQVIEQDLKSVGISLQVHGVSVGLWTSDLSDGNFELSMAFSGTGPTPYHCFSFLDTSGYAPDGKQAPNDPERWDNTTTTKELHQFATTDSLSVQKSAIDALETVMVTQVPLIPLVYNGVQAEWSTSQFTGFPSKSDPYAWPAYGPENEIVVVHLRPVT